MAKTRVLVVDDSVVMRRIITDILASDRDIEVVATAAHGRIALQKITQVNPDLVTLDIEMPEMNGLEMLRELRKTHPDLPVIMFSTLTSRGASETMEALAAGATDFVTKPANMGSVMESMARLQADLIPKIKACVAGAVAHHTATKVAPAPASPAPPKVITPSGHTANPPIDIICVGSSTGGPNALADVFSNVRGDLPVPVVVTQHMPPLFTAVLAESLSRKSPLRFHEGAEGMELQPGHVYIAPGGRHMEVKSKGLSTIIHLHDGPPEHSCRPAVDVLFRSVAATYGGAVLAIVLTGMGSDGARGCVAVRERKGRVIVQDEASSVVWGMPGSVVQAGAADKVLPPAQIATEINMCVQAVNRFAA